MSKLQKKWLEEGQQAVSQPFMRRLESVGLEIVGSEMRAKSAPVQSDYTACDMPAWITGVDEIDACLASGTLHRAGLHEVEPLRSTDLPSLTGFAFALLARLRSSQPIIWCVTNEQVGEYGHLYAYGVQRFGISPSQIIFSKVNKAAHLHFAMEEALKTDGVGAVLGEGQRPTFTGSRRLSFLTREHKRPCLFLNTDKVSGHGSAALTRWQVTPCTGEEDPNDPLGPGLPTWRVALTRARGGKAMPSLEEASSTQHSSYPWRIVWDDQTFSFHSASVFRNRAFSKTANPRAENDEAMVG